MELAWFIVAIVYISRGEVRSKPHGCPRDWERCQRLYENKRNIIFSRQAYVKIEAACDGRSVALPSVCECSTKDDVCLDNRIFDYMFSLYDNFGNIEVDDVAGCNCGNGALTGSVVTVLNLPTKPTPASVCTNVKGAAVAYSKTIFKCVFPFL